MPDPRELVIYTDGSALQNPGGPGGIAGVVEFPEKFATEPKIIFQEGYETTTNNRMELLGVIKSLQYAATRAPAFSPMRIIIVTDSDYVYGNLNRAFVWKKQKWVNADGRPIENHDLWEKLLQVRAKTSATISWQKGKTSAILKMVDKAAKAAVKMAILKTDSGYKGGKVAPSKNHGGTASMFSLPQKNAVVRLYRKQYSGKGMYKVFFDFYREEESRYDGKYYAYISDKKLSELHRQHRFRVTFVNNQKYPVIQDIEPLL